jgi:hypothetical protein
MRAGLVPYGLQVPVDRTHGDDQLGGNLMVVIAFRTGWPKDGTWVLCRVLNQSLTLALRDQ